MSAGAVLGRLLALVVAVGLVVGALAWRSRDGGGAAAPDDVGASPTATVAAAPGTVRCAAELRLCDRLAELLGDDVEVVTEDGVATARQLVGAEAATPWVTLGALADVVAEARDRGSRPALFAADPAPVATSPLVVAGWQDRLAVLEDACGVTWVCVGEVAGGTWADVGGQSAWGSPKPAHAAPDRSGVGLLVTAQAVASRLDGAAVTTRSLDDPAVQAWFSTLERAVPSFSPSSGSQLVDMVQFGPSSRDVVGTTEAEAAEVLARAGARAADVRVVPATPPVEATLVVAAPAGAAASTDLVDAVRIAGAEAGWRVDGRADVALPTPLPTSTDAPLELSGGALEAVLQRWEQVR